ncbi:MAG: metallophosphoesterase [Deltaproteobacteria bacterium]|jgi:predicted MPP superfamily phosphohydrolase|nr:metallophosphoesterase [Deltaproteobacteria bacterium]MBW2537030.1 metallophosphoesterase [Deltaproteobacteria bacterium]
MPRWVLFLIFFSVSVLILGSVHFYFYRRLFVAPVLPPPWPKVGAVALIVATLSFPISFFVVRTLEIGPAKLVVFPVYVWLGVMMMLFFTLLGIDVVRGAIWLGSRIAGQDSPLADPGRRQLIARLLAGAAAGTVLTASGVALGRGLGRLAMKRVDVLLRNLPPELDGFTIAQLTDLHLGAMRHGSWVDEVVRETNRLHPDLIAITGDLADATPQQLAREVAALGRLEAKHGVYFVTGNHEYFIDLPGWLHALRSIGIRVLRNERVAIGRGDAEFDLAGVDDHQGARMAPGHGPDVAKAMRGADGARASVLLAHQPRVIFEAAEHRIGLVLSGHTHGGQIWPWRYLVYLQQPYVSGLHEHEGTQIYVSEGTGFWGPPMRLGSTAEISLVTLRSPGRAGSDAPDA